MKAFLLVDKDAGWTSFDIVKVVRKLSGERRIGHSGVLDKLATGLMILALGEGTKFLEYLIGLDKEYEVKVRFGVVSATYDAEGPLLEMSAEKFGKFTKIAQKNLKKDLQKIIKENFLGKIEQIPPKYSALKIAGKRAADRVRAGEKIVMKSREIKIYDFKILALQWPEASFRVSCSSGTYIRSLVHDLGQKLGCGAYVLELRRTKIDNFDVLEAIELDKLVKSDKFVKSGELVKSDKFVKSGELVKLDKFVKSGKVENIDRNLFVLEEFLEKWRKISPKKSFRSVKLSNEEFLDLSQGRVVIGKKELRGELVAALYDNKIVGILEDFRGGIKFKKRIF